MLGPLPRLHTMLVVGVALLVGVTTGAIVGLSEATGAERLAIPGALIGAAAAGVATYLLLHDFHRAHQHAHQRVQRRHRPR